MGIDFSSVHIFPMICQTAQWRLERWRTLICWSSFATICWALAYAHAAFRIRGAKAILNFPLHFASANQLVVGHMVNKKKRLERVAGVRVHIFNVRFIMIMKMHHSILNSCIIESSRTMNAALITLSLLSCFHVALSTKFDGPSNFGAT